MPAQPAATKAMASQRRCTPASSLTLARDCSTIHSAVVGVGVVVVGVVHAAVGVGAVLQGRVDGWAMIGGGSWWVMGRCVGAQ